VSACVSVVVPVYNGGGLLRKCLRALVGQTLDRDLYEVVVVDDGSSDDSADVARSFDGVTVLQRPHRGVAAARNAGWRAASGNWIASTDADCLPSRGWLASLLAAVRLADERGECVAGCAGRTLGVASDAPSARFCDLIGSYNAEINLAHPRFPYAPTGNVLYGRDALATVGGFDERYRSYEAADLHLRLRQRGAGTFLFEPRAIVLHHHRTNWGRYWRQQVGYGRGYAQFLWHHRDEIPWSSRRELRAWEHVATLALEAVRAGRGREALIHRGRLVKELALRVGFDATYWNPHERARW